MQTVGELLNSIDLDKINNYNKKSRLMSIVFAIIAIVVMALSIVFFYDDIIHSIFIGFTVFLVGIIFSMPRIYLYKLLNSEKDLDTTEHKNKLIRSIQLILLSFTILSISVALFLYF